jgi:thiamine biosynthesis lipoprotein
MKSIVVLLGFAPLAVLAADLRLESSVDAMGSTFTVVALGRDRVRLESAVEQALEEAQRLDSLLSNYKPRSEWSRVNREAAAGPVHVSPELFRLLEACEAFSRASEGTFDITVGPLVKVWGFYKGSGRLPHRAEIRAALAKVGYKGVKLDRENLTVRFAREGMEIDPGGIGKGYAVDRMVAVLKENGIASALVSAGGSSIYALGSSPGENGWKVNIRHPRNPSRMVAELTLRDESMSTSGSYEKFFVAGGKTYSHVFDPRTGYPAQGVASASVIAPATLESEAWTKPMFILGGAGRDRARRVIPKGFRVLVCEDRVEPACAWLQ